MGSHACIKLVWLRNPLAVKNQRREGVDGDKEHMAVQGTFLSVDQQGEGKKNPGKSHIALLR